MSKTWLWGDPHFGHRNIITFEDRPFIDTEHMDNHIIETYNNTVDDGDIVFWLGDMFFCNSERRNYIVQRLKLDGKRNIWIRGNHDKETNNKIRTLGFMPCKMYYYLGMMLTHHPMTPSAINWLRLYNSGRVINAHAHTHGADTGLDPTRWQCVSMEKTDYKPILWSDVMKRAQDGDAIQQWHDKTGGKLPYFDTNDHLRR